METPTFHIKSIEVNGGQATWLLARCGDIFTGGITGASDFKTKREPDSRQCYSTYQGAKSLSSETT